jgi:hypothetical protein
MHLRVPVQVLQSRMVHRSASQVNQVLIKWSKLHDALASWEDYEALKQKFPSVPAWHHAAFEGGGNVTPDAVAGKNIVAGNRCRRGLRVRRPNVTLIGLEWASSGECL